MSLDSNLGALLDVIQLVDRQAAILLFFPCDELPVELEGLTRAQTKFFSLSDPVPACRQGVTAVFHRRDAAVALSAPQGRPAAQRTA